MVSINSRFVVKAQKSLHHGFPNLRKAIKEIPQPVISVFQSRISWNFNNLAPLIKQNFMKADCSFRFINSVTDEFQKDIDYGNKKSKLPSDFF